MSEKEWCAHEGLAELLEDGGEPLTDAQLRVLRDSVPTLVITDCNELILGSDGGPLRIVFEPEAAKDDQ